MEQSQWYCIVNPSAGAGRTTYLWPQACQRMQDRGISFTSVMAQGSSQAQSLAYEACARGVRRFISVGGDGTAHQVYQGIMQYIVMDGCDPSEFYFGVIPIGSGNDWVKSVGLPCDPDKVIDIIAQGHFQSFDIVTSFTPQGMSYMLNCAGAGFDSLVCEIVERQKSLGLQGRAMYSRALVHAIRTLKRMKLTAVADGHIVYDGEAYSVAVGNGAYSGGGLRQVPLARTDDGIINYMIVPILTLPKIIEEVPRLLNGRLYRSDCVIMGACKDLKLVSNITDQSVEIDGELGCTLPMTITNTGKTIKVPCK